MVIHVYTLLLCLPRITLRWPGRDLSPTGSVVRLKPISLITSISCINGMEVVVKYLTDVTTMGKTDYKILFANSADTSEERLSPSLKVIKEAIINYEIPHNVIEFDNTLESVAKQGVLLINSALTCEVGKTGIHFNIWRPFMSKLLHNMSEINSGVVYILLGNQAQSFKDCIVGKQHIIMDYHPAYYARRGEKMPYNTFSDINKILKGMYGKGIEFYKEADYGVC